MENQRMQSVQAIDAARRVEALKAKLNSAEVGHQENLASISANHQVNVAALQQEIERASEEADKIRGEFESSLKVMENEYQIQASTAREKYERELAGFEKKLSRVEWQYEVTTKCLASMTDKRRLLNEAFETVGVGEEARQVVLRDSGAENDTPINSVVTSSRHVGFPSTSEVTDVEGPLYPHYSGYSPYGGGAGVATPFKQPSSASSSPPVMHIVGQTTTMSLNSSASTHTDGSVTDRFIAAILDGDVQGMQTVVRSQGEDLRSSYWRGVVYSVQPLHRAISGLQYHGSDQLLLGMLKALIKLGSDVNAVDMVGNTPLHKAVLVCTSKNVVNVVSALLVKGANPNLVNHAGDAPLHLECRRARLASVYVVGALLNAGANPS